MRIYTAPVVLVSTLNVRNLLLGAKMARGRVELTGTLVLDRGNRAELCAFLEKLDHFVGLVAGNHKRPESTFGVRMDDGLKFENFKIIKFVF